MTCKNCGNSLAPGARFCNVCGAPATQQPTREEVRARIRGGAQHAAPRASFSGGTELVSAAQSKLGPQHTPLLCLAAVLLGVLQIIYLLLKTVYVTLGVGQDNLDVASYSFYGALKTGESTGLGVFLVLVTLALLASIAVPMILDGRPRPLITAGVSLLLMILYVVAIFKLKSFFGENFLGAKPKLGFWGWMYLLNCLLIPALTFLGGQVADAVPEAPPAAPAGRAAPAAVRSGARPVSPLQKAPSRPGPNGPVRPAAPGRNVTPPDAETIAALRRMAQMHKEGLVSDEEFARIKAECVARGWIRES